jgi:hypothetical protein
MPNPQPIHIYLDASTLISFTEADNDFISELIKLCKDKNYMMDITPFTIMESLGVKQEHAFFNKKVAEGMPLKWIISRRRERDLSSEELKKIYSVIERKLKPQGMDAFYFPEKIGEFWKLALNIVRDSNINSSDAVHLGQAISMESYLLVTTDKQFCDESTKYLKTFLPKSTLLVCMPKDAIEILKRIS